MLTFLSASTKAVADGSMSFFLNHFVRTRVSKLAYGMAIQVQYNPSDPEHMLRAQNVYYSEVTEKSYLNGIFATILSKVSPVNTFSSGLQCHNSHQCFDTSSTFKFLRHKYIAKHSLGTPSLSWISRRKSSVRYWATKALTQTLNGST